MANNLLTPILEGGIRSTNFFNGRLLSGEDLSLEKAANRDARRRLGRAAGNGVAIGLEVTEATGLSTAAQPVVTITPGLAMNKRGQTLMLTTKTDVVLARSADSGQSEQQTFGDCAPVSPDVYVAGAGVYLFVICPATGKEGRAPVSGLGNMPARCNTKYTVECVQFRLIKLDVSDHDLTDVAHLRNRMAYKCFGVTDANCTDYLSNPFGTHEAGYGLLDALRSKVLTDCDVPLAILFWTSTGGLEFIDMWAVRRRITPPDSGDSWLSLVGARRLSEGEAMFLQFQDQIEDIRASATNLASIEATTRFDFLPAVGILPIAGERAPMGFDYLKFFTDLTCRDPVFVEGVKVGALLRTALGFPPIDLSSKEMIWLYRVRENMESVADSAARPPQACMIFTRGHIAFQGNAQYDLSKWDYSNFALNAG